MTNENVRFMYEEMGDVVSFREDRGKAKLKGSIRVFQSRTKSQNSVVLVDERMKFGKVVHFRERYAAGND